MEFSCVMKYYHSFIFFLPYKNVKTILSTWVTQKQVLAGIGPLALVYSLSLKKANLLNREQFFFQANKVYAKSELHLTDFCREFYASIRRCIFKTSFLECRLIIISLIIHFFNFSFPAVKQLFSLKRPSPSQGNTVLTFYINANRLPY